MQGVVMVVVVGGYWSVPIEEPLPSLAPAMGHAGLILHYPSYPLQLYKPSLQIYKSPLNGCTNLLVFKELVNIVNALGCPKLQAPKVWRACKHCLPAKVCRLSVPSMRCPYL